LSDVGEGGRECCEGGEDVNGEAGGVTEVGR
jgi:hypothetical protein